MKKSIFYMLLVPLMVQGLTAQKICGGAGFVKLGYANAPGSGDVFAKIAPQGMNTFTDNYALLGLEGYFRTGRLIIGLEGAIGAHNFNSVNSQYAETFTGAGHLRLGWVLQNCKKHQFYPSIGTGNSVTIMTTYPKINGESQNVQNLFLFSPSFDFGLNYDIIIGKVADDATKFGGFMLGFRTGYRFSPSKNTWRDGNLDKVSGLPSYANRGFYLTMTLGGGGFREK